MWGQSQQVIAVSPARHISILMTASVIAAASFCGLTASLHFVSIVVAIIRCRPRGGATPPREGPPVTIVRPVCGLDNFVEETLRTSFELAYPAFELILCVASARDPVVPVVRNLIAAYPGVKAQLLVGDDRVSSNPKLNNCVKGWRAAAHPFIAIADSNVLIPKDGWLVASRFSPRRRSPVDRCLSTALYAIGLACPRRRCPSCLRERPALLPRVPRLGTVPLRTSG
jgi:hypothetical protein